jgi:hypothetical protein
VLFLIPFLFGLAGKLARDIHEFIDMETLICAGQNVLLHISPYIDRHACPAMAPASFVYPPLTARLAALVQRKISVAGIAMVYGFVYFSAFLAILRRAVRSDERSVWRAPLLLSFSASGLLAGNISVILHAVIFLA